jgi:hypothetical protein
MDAIWSKVKEYAMKPILGVPAVVVVAVAAAGAYLFLGKKRGGRKRLF